MEIEFENDDSGDERWRCRELTLHRDFSRVTSMAKNGLNV